MSEERRKNNLIISITLIVYVFLYFLLINKFIPNFSTLINCIFIISLTIFTYLKYGFQSCELNKVRKKVIIEVLLMLILYFAFINILGLIIGFISNTSITLNTILLLISIINLEIFRYIFITSNKDSKEYIIYGTFLITLLDIILYFTNIDNTLIELFIFFTVIVLPLIFKNVTLSYLTNKVGYHSCLIYVILFWIFSYIIPNIPSLGNYLTSVLNILLPSFIYLLTSKLITSSLDENEYKKEIIKSLLIGIPLIIIFTFIVCLTSFKFKYSIVGVDTNKLEPKLNEGDLILVKKIPYDEYKLGDIIVYKLDDKIVLSEITNINNEIYVLYYYENGESTTKTISKENILGKYNDKKISNLGYPTIWFNDFINGSVN